MGHFCPPGSGSGFRIRIRIHLPDWIRIPNPDPQPCLEFNLYPQKRSKSLYPTQGLLYNVIVRELKYTICKKWKNLKPEKLKGFLARKIRNWKARGGIVVVYRERWRTSCPATCWESSRTATAGRSSGLSSPTSASTSTKPSRLDKSSTASFILQHRYAKEMPGFVGSFLSIQTLHLNNKNNENFVKKLYANYRCFFYLMWGKPLNVGLWYFMYECRDPDP